MYKFAILFALCTGVLWGQTTNPSPAAGSATSAQPAASGAAAKPGAQNIDEVMKDLYGTITGPAGQKRDPEHFRSLFVKDFGRLSVMRKDPKTGALSVKVLSPEDYIEKSFPYLEKNGFYESEVSRKTERFGDILQVWSTYESRNNPGEKPFQRGINGVQFVNDGTGWKILSIYWEGERPDNPIPEQYLATH